MRKERATPQVADRPISSYLKEVVDLYRADGKPWVIGYSGGKDSTAVLRLVFEALMTLAPTERVKPIFVVSSDTLVETPIVVGIIRETLQKVERGAAQNQLNLSVAQVIPKTSDTFWVNLIGRGYPAPTRQFRWCTERMKIDPVSEFILSKVAAYGEVVVLLGSRTSESASRAQVMKKHKIEGMRLARHTSLPNAYVYTPIEDWSTDDVWEYLFSGPAPWGGTHQALFDLYKDSNSGECPLVIDKTTPSCGNSRFGCWVCTVVTQDKAMDGLIESGHDWLVPLQAFRNLLFETTLPENKHKYRHDKRRTGKVTVVLDDNGDAKRILGPYRLEVRKTFLRKLLETQKLIDQTNSSQRFDLITKPELEEIRIMWRTDPIEPDWEDSVPKLYMEVFGKELDWLVEDDATFSKLESEILSQLQDKHGVSKELLMKLVELELSMEGLSKRSAIFRRMEEIVSQDWESIDRVAARRASEQGTLVERDATETELLNRYKNLSDMVNNAS